MADWCAQPDARAAATATADTAQWILVGMINPGTDNIPIKNATLTPDGWVLRIEAAAKDGTIAFEGKIENLAMHNRSITGTWKSPKETGKFKIALMPGESHATVGFIRFYAVSAQVARRGQEAMTAAWNRRSNCCSRSCSG